MATDLKWRVLQFVSDRRVLVRARFGMCDLLEEVSLRDARVFVDIAFVHDHAGGNAHHLKSMHNFAGVLFRRPRRDGLIEGSAILIATEGVRESGIVG